MLDSFLADSSYWVRYRVGPLFFLAIDTQISQILDGRHAVFPLTFRRISLLATGEGIVDGVGCREILRSKMPDIELSLFHFPLFKPQ